ncbi:MAG TPA: hypothetical protein VGR14_07590 [Verrucomicrobiae bacterium]|jgi:hypothetical protein|nr:hypothetical protein [Verrucomicrobiae bacterium]
MSEPMSEERKSILDDIRKLVDELGGTRPTKQQLVEKLKIP